jgi:hypothetical protein
LNTQEYEKLHRFLQALTQARVDNRDVDAEKLILEACSQQPAATYLLVQRCLLQDQALSRLESENARLRQDLAAAHGNGGSFLGGNDWGNSASATAAPRPLTSAQAQPLANAQAQPPAAPAASPAWGGSGMLGAVASTAAGVVAGSFLFQGIEHLMGNHAGGSAFSGGQRSALAEAPAADNFVSNTADYARDLDSASGSDSGSDSGIDFDALLPSDSDLDSV